MKNTFSLNLFTYLLAYLLTSLKKIFFSGSTNETFFTPEHFIFYFFFSWFYTWTFFFPSWKKVYSWIIFYFYNCIFRIKIWKKGIKRLSWGQEKRKINRFTKKILFNFFFFFPSLFYRKTFFVLTWEKVLKVVFFFLLGHTKEKHFSTWFHK